MTGHTGTEKSDPAFIEKTSLRVSFETPSSTVLLGEAVPVNMTLHNSGDQSRPFLPINTAFEPQIQADIFEVRYNGELQPYLGIIASRLAVTHDDILMLDPDEKLEQTVNIAELYRMESPGDYEIRYIPRQLVVGENLGVTLEKVAVDTDRLVVTVQ
ncbi:MAG: hypothetical protein AB8B64_01925 [Granulosicoccus sp.]